MKVLLDSNFLLVPIQFKVDFFEEIPRLLSSNPEYVVLSGCLDELKSFKGKDKIAAQTMLGVLEKKGFEKVPSVGKPDNSIVEYASENEGVVVCTNDQELRKRLKEKSVKTIFLRKKNHLAIE